MLMLTMDKTRTRDLFTSPAPQACHLTDGATQEYVRKKTWNPRP